VLLKVFNTETKRTRDVTVTPTFNWPGSGLVGIRLQLTPCNIPLDDLNEVVDFHTRSKSTDSGDGRRARSGSEISCV
jgi:hypothetical protein